MLVHHNVKLVYAKMALMTSRTVFFSHLKLALRHLGITPHPPRARKVQNLYVFQ